MNQSGSDRRLFRLLRHPLVVTTYAALVGLAVFHYQRASPSVQQTTRSIALRLVGALALLALLVALVWWTQQRKYMIRLLAAARQAITALRKAWWTWRIDYVEPAKRRDWVMAIAVAYGSPAVAVASERTEYPELVHYRITFHDGSSHDIVVGSTFIAARDHELHGVWKAPSEATEPVVRWSQHPRAVSAVPKDLNAWTDVEVRDWLLLRQVGQLKATR